MKARLSYFEIKFFQVTRPIEKSRLYSRRSSISTVLANIKDCAAIRLLINCFEPTPNHKFDDRARQGATTACRERQPRKNLENQTFQNFLFKSFHHLSAFINYINLQLRTTDYRLTIIKKRLSSTPASSVVQAGDGRLFCRKKSVMSFLASSASRPPATSRL